MVPVTGLNPLENKVKVKIVEAKKRPGKVGIGPHGRQMVEFTVSPDELESMAKSMLATARRARGG